MANENFFDPIASSNLPEDDPMRAWVAQVQSDPQLASLMTTDPQGAMNRMRELGIPPPPMGFTAYTDGLSAENSVPNRHPKGASAGTYGGAPPPSAPYPPTGDAMTADARPPSLVERGVAAVRGAFPTFNRRGELMGNLTSAQGQPPTSAGADLSEQPTPSVGVPVPRSDPRKEVPAGVFLDPQMAEGDDKLPENATSTEGTVVKKGDAKGGFSELSKGLQGVKPPPGVPPQRISSPAPPRANAIQAPQLQSLLSLVGQPASPVAMTLGRLLATGKA